jgi:hypothetical protein
MRSFTYRSLTQGLSLGGTVAVLVVLLGACASSAGAVVPGAAWSVQSIAGPTNFAPGDESGEEDYRVSVRNIGSRATDGSPVIITDTLPPGVTPDSNISRVRLWEAKGTPINEEAGPCTEAPVVQCVYSASAVPAGDLLDMVIPVGIAQSTPEGSITNTVSVTGGGAPSVTVSAENAIDATPAPFAIRDFGFGVTGLGGAPETQAGAHPYGLSTAFDFTTEDYKRPNGPGGELEEGNYAPSQGVKDVVVDLPLGLVGSVLAAPRCPEADLEGGLSGPTSSLTYLCPSDTKVADVALRSMQNNGIISSVVPESTLSPVYNLVPEHGYAAEFGFEVHNIAKVHLFANVVHTSAGYVLRVTTPDIPSRWSVYFTEEKGFTAGTTLSFFGDPEAEDGTGNPPVPYYTNPSACSGEPLAATAHIDTWEHQGAVNADGSPNFSDPTWLEAKSEMPPTTGCGLLQFNPSFTLAPETAQADSPTGVTTDLRIPQAPDNDFSLATPDLKSAVVALPAGLALSPSAADGLQACSDAQFAEGSTHPATCPEASQVGTAVAHTPSLGEALEGQVFVGSPDCSPCTPADAQDGRMVRLFMQLQAPKSGIVIKVPASVSVDPITGALVASFQGLPQQPVEDLKLNLEGGPRAPLATPEACGTYTTNGVLTPWSAPQSGPPAESPSSFGINTGCVGGFAPSFTAGTTNNQAGAFSPLGVTFSRGDEEQNLSGVRVTTPPGLLGILRGVERCPEPQASQGTCGPGSLVGHATAGAGAGSHPFYTGGEVFLTGPYRGAPFGLSVVVPAVAGPFNLGTIVVRAAIGIDPHTAQITVTSDPLPRMIDGIPLQIKTVNVSIDRSGFLFNPTDCEPLSVGGVLSSVQGASAGVSSRFQAANCAALPFKPVFSVSTQAATSKHNGASLLVKSAFPAGEAGIHSVAVTLPVQLPARLTTIQQACTEAVFNANPASCPAGSNIGTATASAPILSTPIAGPVYLVSHGGAAFPDVVAILQGEGVTVDLTGSISIKHNITSSTFASVPDAPITSFTLMLPEGPHSGLAAVVPAKNKGSLCGQSLAMPFTTTGQNGAVIKQPVKIQVTGCPKPRKKAVKKHKAKPKKK